MPAPQKSITPRDSRPIPGGRAAGDPELVRRFQAGDEAAFAEIVMRHRARAYSLAYSLLRDRGDAEEVAQDTFIRAHRALAQFRGESSLGTWLHHIAVNLARNRYWYFFRRRRYTTCSLDGPIHGDVGETTLLDRLDSAAPTPVDEIAEAEYSSSVEACLYDLDRPQREVLIQRVVLNRTYRQMARLLRVELGTVKSRIARARRQLRLQMKERYPEFGIASPLVEGSSRPRRGSGRVGLTARPEPAGPSPLPAVGRPASA